MGRGTALGWEGSLLGAGLVVVDCVGQGSAMNCHRLGCEGAIQLTT